MSRVLIVCAIWTEEAACWLSPENTEITFRRIWHTELELQRAVTRFNPR